MLLVATGLNISYMTDISRKVRLRKLRTKMSPCFPLVAGSAGKIWYVVKSHFSLGRNNCQTFHPTIMVIFIEWKVGNISVI